jgi:HK97 family phage major capsid protein
MAVLNSVNPDLPNDHQGRLAYVPDDLLPPNIAGPIFQKAQETSILLRTAQRIEVDYGSTVIPVQTKFPEVGQVGTGTTNAEREGGVKPTTGIAWGSRSFKPIKLAGVITMSEEFAKVNPQKWGSNIQADLARAMSRGMDLAVYQGKVPLTGQPVLGIDQENVIANTTNKLFLDQPNVALIDQLITGYDLVADQHEFSGWAVDPRYRGKLARMNVLRDVTGQVADPSGVNLQSPVGELLGFPAQYGRAIGGDLGLATDSGIRLIGGDFSQIRYGYADEIRYKVTDEATVDGVSMWQTNQVAVLIEVTFGWVVGDLDAFVRFDATGYTPPTGV